MTGAGGETVIRLEGVETRFGRQRVHAGIDLEVRRGEIFALVGGSGSGKTTLLRVMLLLHRPSAGRVVLLGHDAARCAGAWACSSSTMRSSAASACSRT